MGGVGLVLLYMGFGYLVYLGDWGFMYGLSYMLSFNFNRVLNSLLNFYLVFRDFGILLGYIVFGLFLFIGVSVSFVGIFCEFVDNYGIGLCGEFFCLFSFSDNCLFDDLDKKENKG